MAFLAVETFLFVLEKVEDDVKFIELKRRDASGVVGTLLPLVVPRTLLPHRTEFLALHQERRSLQFGRLCL